MELSSFNDKRKVCIHCRDCVTWYCMLNLQDAIVRFSEEIVLKLIYTIYHHWLKS